MPKDKFDCLVGLDGFAFRLDGDGRLFVVLLFIGRAIRGSFLGGLVVLVCRLGGSSGRSSSLAFFLGLSFVVLAFGRAAFFHRQLFLLCGLLLFASSLVLRLALVIVLLAFGRRVFSFRLLVAPFGVFFVFGDRLVIRHILALVLLLVFRGGFFLHLGVFLDDVFLVFGGNYLVVRLLFGFQGRGFVHLGVLFFHVFLVLLGIHLLFTLLDGSRLLLGSGTIIFSGGSGRATLLSSVVAVLVIVALTLLGRFGGHGRIRSLLGRLFHGGCFPFLAHGSIGSCLLERGDSVGSSSKSRIGHGR